MPDDKTSGMSAESIERFLRRQTTGILALARDNEPYAIPISYGYSPAHEEFVVRLVSLPESEKRDFLFDGAKARFVIFDETDKTIQSVIGTGTLERLDPSELTVDLIEQFGAAKRPLFEMWQQSERELTIDLFRFQPDRLDGRVVDVDWEDR